MNKVLARELVKSRKAVKDKYQSLKLAASTTQSELEQAYKPITEPLKQLVSTIRIPDIKDEPIDIKEEFLKIPKSYYQTSTPTKLKKTVLKTGKTPILPAELPSFFDTSLASVSHQPSVQESSVLIAETTPPSRTSADSTLENLNLSDILEQTRQSMKTYVGTTTYQDWLSDFDVLPRAYIDASVKDVEHKFDHNYGIVHDLETDKFFLGLTQKPVEIIGKDIKVQGITYPGTAGLFELLFKKEPLGYKEKDLDNYMDILHRTNAYRRNHDANERVQGNGSIKYISIIGPYLQKKGITKPRNINQAMNRLAEAFAKPKAPYRVIRTGKGLTLKKNKLNTDYVYWDNVNELVDRLRLLVASTSAGHNSHNNEILSIIEELKEAKVIL